jgi:tRNA-5-methyluridine54 2-sulfurtransferase
MKCLKCGRPAVFHMRHHKLALCEIHYPEWFVKQTERAIRKYRLFDSVARVLISARRVRKDEEKWISRKSHQSMEKRSIARAAKHITLIPRA